MHCFSEHATSIPVDTPYEDEALPYEDEALPSTSAANQSMIKNQILIQHVTPSSINGGVRVLLLNGCSTAKFHHNDGTD